MAQLVCLAESHFNEGLVASLVNNSTRSTDLTTGKRYVDLTSESPCTYPTEDLVIIPQGPHI